MISSMKIYYKPIIKKSFDIIKPTKVVEIGSLGGELTEELCSWAKDNSCKIEIIETKPQDALLDIVENYSFTQLHIGDSLNKLKNISEGEIFIIDGDHNYYTVFNELKLIIKNNNPQLIFIHDIGWPWGRRDIYYQPDKIPKKHRQEYTCDLNLGIMPENPGTTQNYGLQSSGNYCFAINEGGKNNGVLTAIENILNTRTEFKLYKINCWFGLGVLIRKDIEKFSEIEEILSPYTDNPLISLLEKGRIESYMEYIDLNNKYQKLKTKQFESEQKIYQNNDIQAEENSHYHEDLVIKIQEESDLKHFLGENNQNQSVQLNTIISNIQNSYEGLYNQTLKSWAFNHQRNIVLNKSRWMGIKCLKNPLDAWIYQELIVEIKPDYIIEIGSKYGGSTLFFANLLELLGRGEVISIDIDHEIFEVKHERIISLTGDSGSPKILDHVKKLCDGKKVFIIQDADHSRGAVLKDLYLYSKFVSAESYFIVEDGIVDLFDGFEPSFIGQGPIWAIEEFLMTNKNFVIDNFAERFILTQSPRGFLKRVR